MLLEVHQLDSIHNPLLGSNFQVTAFSGSWLLPGSSTNFMVLCFAINLTLDLPNDLSVVLEFY